MSNNMPNSLKELSPSLTVSCGAYVYGLAVDDNGFIVPLRRGKDTAWIAVNSFPPVLASHIDLFITQNYNIINNQYGLPKPSGDKKCQ